MAVPDGEVRPVPGDSEDDLVLATSRLGRAEYLITCDQGLLDRGRHDGVTILSLYGFLPFLSRVDKCGDTCQARANIPAEPEQYYAFPTPRLHGDGL